MFNLGFSEIVLIGVIALIFIGPQQLPDVARTIGRLLNEWKRATSDLQSSLTTTITSDFQERIHQNRIGEADTAIEPAAATEATLPAGAAPVGTLSPDEQARLDRARAMAKAAADDGENQS